MKMKKVKKQCQDSYFIACGMLIIGSLLVATAIFPVGTPPPYLGSLLSLWGGICLVGFSIYVLISSEIVLMIRGLEKQMNRDKEEVISMVDYFTTPKLPQEKEQS